MALGISGCLLFFVGSPRLPPVFFGAVFCGLADIGGGDAHRSLGWLRCVFGNNGVKMFTVLVTAVEPLAAYLYPVPGGGDAQLPCWRGGNRPTTDLL